jgi:hypothetical protein
MANRETYDFAVTATLPTSLLVSEFLGAGHDVTRALRAGIQVTITYYYGATNCNVIAHRRDHSAVNRDFSATPAAVLAATGIDVTAR